MGNLLVGCSVEIDLAKRKIERFPTLVDERFRFISRGITLSALAHLTKSTPHPEKFIMGASLLSGTVFPGSGCLHLAGTGGNDTGPVSPDSALSGGFSSEVSAELKFAGFDVLLMSGRAEKLSYLYITDNRVEIRDAEFLRGKSVEEVQRELVEQLGSDCKIIGIGKAGEDQIAHSVIQDGITSAESPLGFGPLLGSMNIKAIAVQGHGKIEVQDPARLVEVCRESHLRILQASDREKISKDYSTRREEHTVIDHFNRNYRAEGVGCFGCPLQCYGNYDLPQYGKSILSSHHLQHLFTLTGHKDGSSVYRYAQLCREYGIDGISLLEMVKNSGAQNIAGDDMAQLVQLASTLVQKTEDQQTELFHKPTWITEAKKLKSTVSETGICRHLLDADSSIGRDYGRTLSHCLGEVVESEKIANQIEALQNMEKMALEERIS